MKSRQIIGREHLGRFIIPHEVALITAVLGAHYLDGKNCEIQEYDEVLDAACDFYRNFELVDEWPEYIDRGDHKDAGGNDINPADWEDFVVMWSKPYFPRH